MRTSPENITTLEPNQIFVFGSNKAGRHGKGAAKQALTWGAIPGQAKGLQGRTYGIPTKDHNLKVLSVDDIKKYVDEFVSFAHDHPELEFLVTEVGCGLAGYKPKDIAPLFRLVLLLDIENIKLPKRFLARLL